jgi:hypothetical protein
MDDTQRIALTGLGGGFMGAALTWVSAISLSSHPSVLRYVPPVALFVAGALLFVWALRSGNPARALLDRAISDGRTVARLPDPTAIFMEWERWRRETYEMVREHFGLAAAHGFAEAGGAETSQLARDWTLAQVEFLEGLRT